MPRSSKRKKALAIAKTMTEYVPYELKQFKINSNHTVFCENKKEFKNFLRQMLRNICDSKCIQCSDAEIRSYSKKELKELINTYNFKMNNLYNSYSKSNSMYKTSYFN